MLQSALNLFFPPICACCHSILLHQESVICTSCRHDLPLTQFHLQKNNEAFGKFYGKVEIESAIAFLFYQKPGIVQYLIHDLKYNGNQNVGSCLGEWYAKELLESDYSIPFDIIIPVPLHHKKLKQRGYNQLTTFGKALSQNFNIMYDPTLLKRNSNAVSQSKKKALERSDHLDQVFSVNPSEFYHAKHFLLIDDVITTGATLEACTRALLKIPGAKVSILCMAMSHF